MIRFELSPTVVIDGLTLQVVTRLVIQAKRSKQRCWVVVSKEPYALVIHETERVRAHGMSGEQLSLTTLVGEVPELASILDTAAGN